MEKVLDYIRRWLNTKWYGKITIHIEAGNVVRVTREENIKPKDL